MAEDAPPDIDLAFYGDDFTGSTDALESLSMNGVDTVLFLERPDPDDLAEFDVDAVGIAGQSRAMTPDEMDDELPPTFHALGSIDPDVVHYKVCSTFDSSPEVGSIGHAIDLAQEVYDSPYVPLVVGAPPLAPRGRYVIFGNLFATVDGETYRLDRHPTMSEHPVTPMAESDLRRHLGEQTEKSIGLVDVLDLDDGPETARDTAAATHDVVCFDTLDEDHMETVGRLVWEDATAADGPLFVAGSSGFGYALTAYWEASGRLGEYEPPQPVDAVDQQFVMSGSASPVTRDQIDWALERGHGGVRLDTAALVDPDAAVAECDRAVEAALDVLDDGQSPLLYAARGPDDGVIQETRQRAADLGLAENEVGRRLGRQQGRITRTVLDQTDLDRVCIAGGDTSGHVAPALDIYALETLAQTAPGSPLCRTNSRTERFDGLEIALKGGQIGGDDYFGLVKQGGTPVER